MGHMEFSDNADREFWEELHRLLLSAVCTIERYKFPEKPTTSELRKAGKKVCQVDVKEE
jgi:hypothetical protein